MRRQGLLAFGILGSVIALAQAPPAFDVASVKPNNSVSGGGRAGPSGGSLEFTPGKVAGTATARRIVLEAYHLTDHQLSGGPGWLGNDEFHIEAKAATPADNDQLRLMLQTLLAERFKLVVRHETKEMPVYALMVGRNGPKLHERKEGQPPPTQKELKTGLVPRECSGPLNHYSASRATMQDFADELSRLSEMDRPVLNRTGLQGVYFILMGWCSDGDLLPALEDELGLKLESQKASVDTLVIGHIEKPDPN